LGGVSDSGRGHKAKRWGKKGWTWGLWHFEGMGGSRPYLPKNMPK